MNRIEIPKEVLQNYKYLVEGILNVSNMPLKYRISTVNKFEVGERKFIVELVLTPVKE
jgi:hypothetical protein